MKIRMLAVCVALLGLSAVGASAQQQQGAQGESELRVALTAQPVALDAMGRQALSARLVSTTLQGAVDAPVRNARLVVENRGGLFYTYVSGWATFYDGDGVRCGEGLFKVDALAPGEAVETDMPGARITCSPVSWRIVATNLLTRTSETAKASDQSMTVRASEPAAMTTGASVPPLVISIDGEEHPIQLNNPLVVRMGNRRRTIIVKTAP
ncbi:MAG TPA: hypothetical protein VJS44_18000 [Pyrinomonadaceae bacterium]|nr:hypothetical protein [Pyrinomonadaceae bacterium]